MSDITAVHTDDAPGALLGASGVLQLLVRNWSGADSFDTIIDNVWYGEPVADAGWDKSGTGIIIHSSTATALGTMQAKGAAAITQTQSVVATGVPVEPHSGTAAIAHTATATALPGFHRVRAAR